MSFNKQPPKADGIIQLLPGSAEMYCTAAVIYFIGTSEQCHQRATRVQLNESITADLVVLNEGGKMK